MRKVWKRVPLPFTYPMANETLPLFKEATVPSVEWRALSNATGILVSPLFNPRVRLRMKLLENTGSRDAGVPVALVPSLKLELLDCSKIEEGRTLRLAANLGGVLLRDGNIGSHDVLVVRHTSSQHIATNHTAHDHLTLQPKFKEVKHRSEGRAYNMPPRQANGQGYLETGASGSRTRAGSRAGVGGAEAGKNEAGRNEGSDSAKADDPFRNIG
ncbi:hypothetical protein DFP72DRAFT_852062 [Ephemerocybe angulata]|uniref:Uncharacterized protein n=1 Tax=Ephemerocybe angulata TaxID=980116 RepID=A0A8H6LZQ8_9AGAR|nr:hypothetical protein DFP72DRAFT_852062 [Tulosesus angulatus]